MDEKPVSFKKLSIIFPASSIMIPDSFSSCAISSPDVSCESVISFTVSYSMSESGPKYCCTYPSLNILLHSYSLLPVFFVYPSIGPAPIPDSHLFSSPSATKFTLYQVFPFFPTNSSHESYSVAIVHSSPAFSR